MPQIGQGSRSAATPPEPAGLSQGSLRLRQWYWLVDGLMETGYRIHLANTAAIVPYEGLKYSDDDSDACWLAKLLRWGLLPEGYIYPQAERGVRDLLRKRSQLMRQRTANLPAVQNLLARNLGSTPSANAIKRLALKEVDRLLPAAYLALAVKSNLAILRSVEESIAQLEQTVKTCIKPRPEFQPLLSVSGIGDILGLTILLETGEIRRFTQGGHYASYCRCVGSERISTGQRKGRGNAKNGSQYLAWAFVETAHFAVRYDAPLKRYDQRKCSRSNTVVAIKTVAHKLARACYSILRDQVPFDVNQAFA